MSTEEGFLADIVEHPDDDGPRLVYADWLEEQGESERAGFIRVQCMLAPVPPDGEGEDLDELRRREGYLLDGQQEFWRKRLRLGPADVRLRRGFVEGLRLSAGAWLRHGKRVLKGTPLRWLELYQVADQRDRLLASPTLARLRALDLADNQLGDEGARALAGCAHLAGLEELYLARNAIGDGGVQALALSPHLAGLRVLDLSANEVGDSGARALAASPHLKRLRELFLGTNQIGDEGAKALASSGNLASLEELMLFVNEIKAAGARALVGSPHLGALKMLYLNHNRLGAPTRKALEEQWGERISCSPGRSGAS
jgi:uncharacterized protein (TIGR02996 family)